MVVRTGDFRITGYGEMAREGQPFRVVQLPDGRVRSAIPAKAIRLIESRDWAGLERLWRDRRNRLYLSTGPADKGLLDGVSPEKREVCALHVSYKHGALADIIVFACWPGAGAAVALSKLRKEAAEQ